MITQSYLKTRLEYCPESGKFTWLPIKERSRRDAYWNRAHAGNIAGTVKMSGYVRVKLDGIEYAAHRLAWLYAHNETPSSEIDHKDRDRSNNRLDNLRPATRKQNSQNKKIPQNNTSGATGVTWHSGLRKWQASLETDGKLYYFGVHSVFEAAVAARADGQAKVFGEWAGETP